MATSRREQLGIGEEIAGYRVESYLARGGMAVVYRGRDVALSRPVAIKVMAPELASNETFRARFVRESQIAASIDHPNIIPVYGAGEADGLLYIAMRFVAGEDLGVLLRRRGRLPAAEAMPILSAVAGALDTAHALDLVHRDIKPGNILIAGPDSEDDRHVYLTDFGLTKRSNSLTGFTTAGHFLGTIAYVSPEQIENKTVDRRTDLYSLACVMFETLAGSPPFRHDDDAALLWAHVAEPPPALSGRLPGTSPQVDQILQRGMAKNPADRQASCRQLVADLRLALRDAPAAAPTVRQPTPRDLPAQRAARPGEPNPAPPRPRSDPRPPRSPDADLPTHPHRPPRRRRPLLAAAAAVVLVVAAVATWLIVDPPWTTWVTYDGGDSVAPYALQHPSDWLEHPDRQGMMFAHQHLVGIFTTGDVAKWDEAKRSAANPETDEGLLLSKSDQQIGSASPAEAQAAVAGIPAFHEATMSAPVRATVHGAQAWRIDGKLSDPRDPTLLTIDVAYYIVPISGGSIHMIFFALPQRFQELQPTFDRVRDSIQLPT